MHLSLIHKPYVHIPKLDSLSGTSSSLWKKSISARRRTREIKNATSSFHRQKKLRAGGRGPAAWDPRVCGVWMRTCGYRPGSHWSQEWVLQSTGYSGLPTQELSAPKTIVAGSSNLRETTGDGPGVLCAPGREAGCHLASSHLQCRPAPGAGGHCAEPGRGPQRKRFCKKRGFISKADKAILTRGSKWHHENSPDASRARGRNCVPSLISESCRLRK